MDKYIYADNAATTKLDMEAFEEMKLYLLNEYGNASQPYSFSRNVKKALLHSRKIIAKGINAEPDEIYFTSGGTESDNWAIKGVESTNAQKFIITSQIEHKAIIKACEDLEVIGNKVVYLPVNNFGEIDDNELVKAIARDTSLVSIMYANNEIGTIQPIKELAAITHKNGAVFHTDAVQAIGHVNIDVKELDVDLLSASAHKFNGPKGIGFLYVKKGTNISSFISGGSQEFGLRAGTENIASIVGMAIALKNNLEHLEENIKHVQYLENILIEELKSANIDFIRNGTNALPGNISLSFKGMSGEILLHRLDLMGVLVSTGSACDSVNTQISHVIKAINCDKEYAEGTIRISLSKNNTLEDVKFIVNSLIKIIKNIKSA